MEIDIYNTTGKKIEKLDLDESVFGAEPNDKLLSQYIRVYQHNQRQGNASTKDRSEVSGGGRKPWRQKGTGRARHGSIRSPIWTGGGVAHGPKPKSWRLEFPKKMRRAALVSALSEKFLRNRIKIIDAFDIKAPQTKKLTGILEKLKARGKVLLVTEGKDENVLRSANNIRSLSVSMSGNLNAHEVLYCDNIFLSKGAVLKIQDNLRKTRPKKTGSKISPVSQEKKAVEKVSPKKAGSAKGKSKPKKAA